MKQLFLNFLRFASLDDTNVTHAQSWKQKFRWRAEILPLAWLTSKKQSSRRKLFLPEKQVLFNKKNCLRAANVEFFRKNEWSLKIKRKGFRSPNSVSAYFKDFAH